MTRTNKNGANRDYQPKETAERQLESDTSVKPAAAGITQVAPPVMVDGVAEGVVSFPSKLLSSFRYILSMKGDKVSIWLENRKTKQQWKSGELSEAEIVGSDAVIPQAKLTHYVQCFHNCLAAETVNNGASDFQCDLIGNPNGVLKLTFTLKLRVFTSEWMPSYTFELKPVALEAVDILNSKLRDQEEEIEMLRSALNDREEEVGVLRSDFAKFKKSTSCSSNLAFLTAKSTSITTHNQNLSWKQNQTYRGTEFVALLSSGVIRFLKSGIFDLRISVCHSNTNSGNAFELRKMGQPVEACRSSGYSGYGHMLDLNCIVKVMANDEYSVVYTGDNCAYPESKLIVLLLVLE